MIFVVVKLLDPVIIILGLILGYASKTRYYAIGFVALVAVIHETFLTVSQITRVWGQGIISALVAAAVYVAIGYGIKLWWNRRKRDTAELPSED